MQQLHKHKCNVTDVPPAHAQRVIVTTDNGTDRVCTAGIRWILGFTRLELASVHEILSVTNFCFCDDGLASRDGKNAIK
jgi:hypothetical protein